MFMKFNYTRYIRHPNSYRMELAERFAKSGQRVFGKQWKGMYAVGSTASGMACHFRDLDVLPLVEKGEKDDVRWVKLESIGDFCLRKLGVYVEVVKDPDDDFLFCPRNFTPIYLDRILGVGVERAITSEAILISGDSSLNLPVRVEKSEALNSYKRPKLFGGRQTWEHLECMRGDSIEAQKARIQYEMQEREFFRRLLVVITEVIPSLGLGGSERLIIALTIACNVPSLMPGRHYDRVEFLLNHNPALQIFFNSPPNSSEMLAAHVRFLELAGSADEEFFKKIRVLCNSMIAKGFEGPEFLLPSLEKWERLKAKLKRSA